MVTLAELKAKRGNNLKALQQKLEESQSGGAPKDDRIWKPTFNKEKGKGICEIRFLPAKDGDPFVEVKTYSFNGPGGNFYDLARSTIGEEDPVQIAAISMFRKAKNEGDAALKERAKKFLARSNFYANVYIVNDDEKPENNGKVMIYQFGRAIFKKIEKLIKPEFEDVSPIDPFDLWEGANFKIRMLANTMPDSKTGKTIVVPNYDNSEFEKQSEFLNGDDDKLNEVIQQTYDLSEFVDPAKFKSYDDVAERFEKVMGHKHTWLIKGGVEEHIESQQQKAKHDEQQAEPDSSPTIDENDAPFDVDDAEEEDPIEKWKKLARGG